MSDAGGSSAPSTASTGDQSGFKTLQEPTIFRLVSLQEHLGRVEPGPRPLHDDRLGEAPDLVQSPLLYVMICLGDWVYAVMGKSRSDPLAYKWREGWKEQRQRVVSDPTMYGTPTAILNEFGTATLPVLLLFEEEHQVPEQLFLARSWNILYEFTSIHVGLCVESYSLVFRGGETYRSVVALSPWLGSLGFHIPRQPSGRPQELQAEGGAKEVDGGEHFHQGESRNEDFSEDEDDDDEEEEEEEKEEEEVDGQTVFVGGPTSPAVALPGLKWLNFWQALPLSSKVLSCKKGTWRGPTMALATPINAKKFSLEHIGPLSGVNVDISKWTGDQEVDEGAVAEAELEEDEMADHIGSAALDPDDNGGTDRSTEAQSEGEVSGAVEARDGGQAHEGGEVVTSSSGFESVAQLGSPELRRLMEAYFYQLVNADGLARQAASFRDAMKPHGTGYGAFVWRHADTIGPHLKEK